MKNKIRHVVLTGMLLLCLSIYMNAQMGNAGREESRVGETREESRIGETYTGEWKFEAPSAPEGSTKGDIQIMPDAVIMTFDDAVRFPSTWVKFRNDSIIYQVDFDATSVVFSVKIIDKNNMSGKAVWSEGESPFILRKNLGVIL